MFQQFFLLNQLYRGLICWCLFCMKHEHFKKKFNLDTFTWFHGQMARRLSSKQEIVSSILAGTRNNFFEFVYFFVNNHQNTFFKQKSPCDIPKLSLDIPKFPYQLDWNHYHQSAIAYYSQTN